MKFSVTWKPSAEDQLAEIWLNASSELRPQITAAADELDRQLQSRPDEVGESRDENIRLLLLAPLGAAYKIESEDMYG